MNKDLIKKGYYMIAFAPLIYLFAIVISFINPLLSLGAYILIPVLYIILKARPFLLMEWLRPFVPDHHYLINYWIRPQSYWWACRSRWKRL